MKNIAEGCVARGGRGRVEETGKMQGKRNINTHSKTHPGRGRGEGLPRLCLQFQCQKPSLAHRRILLNSSRMND